MAQKTPVLFKHIFSYRHFQTNGKLENLIEGMDQVKQPAVCLSLYELEVEGGLPEKAEMKKRCERLKKVARYLRKKGIKTDILLPGPGKMGIKNLSRMRWITTAGELIASCGIETVWIDDRNAQHPKGLTRKTLLSHLKSYKTRIHKFNSYQKIGYIADSPHNYFHFGLTPAEIAESLSGENNPLLAQSQSFRDDIERTSVLRTACEIKLGQTLSRGIPLTACTEHHSASPFQKCAEADEIQLTLNALHNMHEVLIDCFDRVGTAPGLDNHFLNGQESHRGFLKKLAKFGPFTPVGTTLVVPPSRANKSAPPATSSLPDSAWPEMLWRMGLPVDMIGADEIKPGKTPGTVYLLIGDTPRHLSRRQFNEIFNHGVLMDIEAAETIQEMGLPGLIGVKIGNAPREIETEIISDSTFVHPCYGYNTWWKPLFHKTDFRRVKPFHNNARTITTLKAPHQSPTIPGIAIFDNIDHNHRSAILPYRLHKDNIAALLTTHRQRHTRELLAWLLRRRLDCFVESTPDLVPFFHRLAGRKNRFLLTLLNIGFDWALDSRIQISPALIGIQKVSELNEQGKLTDQTRHVLSRYRDYQFLELENNTAVAPMQTTTFLIE